MILVNHVLKLVNVYKLSHKTQKLPAYRSTCLVRRRRRKRQCWGAPDCATSVAIVTVNANAVIAFVAVLMC